MMPASSINEQTPTKKTIEHDNGVPPLLQNGGGGLSGIDRSLESLLGLSLPSNLNSAQTVHPHAVSLSSREASALPSPSQAGLDLPSLLALNNNLNGSGGLSNPLLANLATLGAFNLGTPSLSPAALQLQVAIALASSANSAAPAPLPAAASNPSLEAVLNGLLTTIGQQGSNTSTGMSTSRPVGPRFHTSAPSARSSGLNGSSSGSGSGESEESLATTGNPNTIKRTGPNVTEHVYVPSSEHVAEIVGRQGIL